ncbi:unknown protein [Microcystis aeruginosa NIES-843]|uniref:Uncharacterized protein n=1 Tax=Microcystis aeruginosa (strain NIES-843 / IAM M-2473) TaxID=449447 RepID=B0JQQ5_MICAN|nr:unknown protein [Microcystis aeruginosa NIES-843]
MSSSITVKCPYQSSRNEITLATFSATTDAEGTLILNKIIPTLAGNLERKASYPKS